MSCQHGRDGKCGRCRARRAATVRTRELALWKELERDCREWRAKEMADFRRIDIFVAAHREAVAKILAQLDAARKDGAT